MTKLKKIRLWQNLKKKLNCSKTQKSNCDKTIKKKIVTKLERSNCDPTQKLKLCKFKKNKIGTTQNSNCDSNKSDSSDKRSYNDIF